MEKRGNAENLLTPLLIPLKLSGMFYGKGRAVFTLHILYASFLFLISIATLVSELYCVCVDDFRLYRDFKILVLVQLVVMAALAACYVFIVPGKLKHVLEFWEKNTTYQILFLPKRFRITLALMIIGSSVICFAFLGNTAYNIAKGGEVFNCTTGTFGVPWPHRILFNVNSLISSYQSIIILIAYVVFGKIVRTEFTNVNTKLQARVSEGGIIEVSHVADLRREHENICKMLRQTDTCFLPLSFNIYVYGVLFQCLCITTIINDPQSSTVGFLLVASPTYFGMFLVAGINAVLVHNSVDCVLETLLELKTTQLADNAYNEVELLIHKLTSSSHGFTVMRLFVVNKSTMFTIVGTMVSYVIVAVQFQAAETV